MHVRAAQVPAQVARRSGGHVRRGAPSLAAWWALCCLSVASQAPSVAAQPHESAMSASEAPVPGDAPVDSSTAMAIDPRAHETSSTPGVSPPDARERARAPALEEAREAIARAQVRFEAGDYGAALAEFLRAHELLAGDPRQKPVLHNIAVCYERMFRYDLAYTFYERYLNEGNPSAADRAEVEEVLRGLRGLLGKLHVRTNVKAEVWIGPHIRLTAPGSAWVPAGPHVVELSAPGYETVRRELVVKARTEQSLDVELSPHPQYRALAPIYFWTGTLLTSAALLTGTAFGIGALNAHKDLERRHARDRLLVTREDEARVQRLALRADIAFGAAALVGVGSVILFFLTDFGRTEAESAGAHKPKPRGASVTPQVSAGAWVLQLSGKLP